MKSPFDSEAIEAALRGANLKSTRARREIMQAALTAAWASLESRGMVSFEDYGDLDFDEIIGANVAIVRLPTEKV